MGVRPTWAIAVVMLVACSLPGDAQAQDPVPDLGLEVSGDPGQHKVLRVRPTGADALLGPERVRVGDFGAPGSWQPGTSETGSTGQAVVEDEELVLRAVAVPRDASLFAFQSVSLADGEMRYALRYRAKDVGETASSAGILLRERGPDGKTADTLFKHELASEWSDYEWTWTPRVSSSSVTLALRILVKQGAEHEAHFDDVSLRPIPELAWSVPTGSLLSQGGLRAEVSFATFGQHDLHVRAFRGDQALWTAHGQVDVANRPPTISLEIPNDPLVDQELRFDASATSDQEAPVRLADPSFLDLGRTWQVSGRELGVNATARAATDPGGQPTLTLEAPSAARRGSLFVFQTLPLTPEGRAPTRLLLGVQDNGQIVEYQFLFRESAGGQTKDAFFRFPSSSTSRVVDMVWTPTMQNATALVVALRAIVDAGQAPVVTFSKPTLIQDVQFQWTLDGVVQPDANSSLVRTFREPGTHTGRLVVEDVAGGRSERDFSFSVRDPGFTWAIAGPSVVPLQPAFSFDAWGTQRIGSRPEAVANGDFSQGLLGWQFSDAEVGGAGAARVVDDGDGPFARMTTLPVRPGSLFLYQSLQAPFCIDSACVVTFQVRAVEGGLAMESLVRSRGDRDLKLVDDAVGPTWTRHVAEWRPTSLRDQVVSLRFLASASEQVIVDVRQVSVRPLVTFSAQAEGALVDEIAPGTARIDPLVPGKVRIAWSVETHRGLTSRHEQDVEALPFALYRTWDGKVAVVGSPGDLGGARIAGRDAERIEFLDAQGRAHVRLGAVDSGHPLTLDAGATSADLSAAHLDDALPARPPELHTELQPAGWQLRGKVEVRTTDESIQGGTARLIRNGNVVDEAGLVPNEGGWFAEFDTGQTGGDHTVEVVLQNGWNEQLRLQSTPSTPSSANLWLGVALVALLVASLVGFGVARRRQSRRGGT